MRSAMAFALVAATAMSASAAVKTSVVEYNYEGTTLKGYFAYDDAKTGKRPAVMVVHEWWGLNEDAKKRAEMLAELGYVAFCADMYGNGQVAQHPTDAGKMATEVRSNVKNWLGRANAGLDVLKKHERVDAGKIAVIGYCFGGSTALQLALAGNDLKAVVSFHGALPTTTVDQAKKIKCRVLVCHGGADSFISEDTIKKFRTALDEAKSNYQFESYPGVKHSFTVKDVGKWGIDGLAYDEGADKKSWESMKKLFKEVLE